jgi:glycosyltransferase involved in cell wall biosynthesis
VYQGHLATMGGGERYALELARSLAEEGHDVDLLAPRPAPLAAAGARLGVEVGGLRPVELDPRRVEDEAGTRSGDYDLFVNCTHNTGAVSRASMGICICHFPYLPVERPVPGAVAGGRGTRFGHAEVIEGLGLVRDPALGLWTDGAGRLTIVRSGRERWRLELTLARRRAGWRSPGGPAEILLDGTPVRRLRLPPVGWRTVSVPLPVTPAQSRHSVQVVSASGQRTGDGPPVGAFLRRSRLRCPGSREAPGALPAPLQSYSSLVSTSAYTAGWIQEWWGTKAAVVHPAVSTVEPRRGMRKRQSIVVIGRFFTGGHSKRQLELVHAFRRLCDTGVTGWRLDLVGGIETAGGKRYAEAVCAAAEGYPVSVMTGTSRSDLEDLLRQAAILWQAPGWGEDARASPDRFEHFGISTVEAMSAGVVPVALGIGGVREIVRDGVDGLLWLDGPEAATRALIDDPSRLSQMSRAARARAQEFSTGAFRSRLAEVLASVGFPPSSSG